MEETIRYCTTTRTPRSHSFAIDKNARSHQFVHRAIIDRLVAFPLVSNLVENFALKKMRRRVL